MRDLGCQAQRGPGEMGPTIPGDSDGNSELFSNFVSVGWNHKNYHQPEMCQKMEQSI